MPAWVAARLRDYPQVPEGNALRDPLPVPFTAAEVRNALIDVWRASHQFNDRRCATVSAAAVQTALQVLPILDSRNGGWMDFSGRAYGPWMNTPGSNQRRGVNLLCLLIKLAGKPIPAAFGCSAASPHPSRLYNTLDIATTFDGTEVIEFDRSPSLASWFGKPFPAQPGLPIIGFDIEVAGLDAPASLQGLPLFELVASFGPHEHVDALSRPSSRLSL